MIYVRVYIAIILLLLLLTVSQVCALRIPVIKEPTYKIRASNSINKAALRCRPAVDPAVRMAFNPAGWSRIIAFEKTLMIHIPSKPFLLYHARYILSTQIRPVSRP